MSTLEIIVKKYPPTDPSNEDKFTKVIVNLPFCHKVDQYRKLSENDRKRFYRKSLYIEANWDFKFGYEMILKDLDQT